MAGPIHQNEKYTPPRAVGPNIQPFSTEPSVWPQVGRPGADLMNLAQLLKIRNALPTPPVTVQNNTPNFGALANPQAMGAANMPTDQTAVAPPTIQAPPPPANQPAAVAAAPPMSPTDQTVPPMPAPTQIGPVATSTSVWDTLKKMLANGQVPEGYRGAMGEMIKNG